MIGKCHLRGWPTDELNYWKLLAGGGGQGHYYNPEFQLMGGGTEKIEGYSTDIITDLSIEWMEKQHQETRVTGLFAAQRRAKRMVGSHTDHETCFVRREKALNNLPKDAPSG